MTRPGLHPAALVCALAACALALGACDDGKKGTSVGKTLELDDDGAGGAPKVVVSPEATPRDLWDHKARAAGSARELDERARELLRSFKERAYDPHADDKLVFATADLTVRTRNTGELADRVARYRMTFDETKMRDNPETGEKARPPFSILPEEGNDEMPKGVMLELYQIVHLAVLGPVRYVLSSEPPVGKIVAPSSVAGNLVVRCPADREGRVVSYNLDERQVVVARGTIGTQGAKTKQVDHYAWREYKGRFLLERASVKGHPTETVFGYDDAHGPALLETSRLTRGEAFFQVTFAWDRVDATPRKPPGK